MKETVRRNRVLPKKLGFSELFCTFFWYERTYYLFMNTPQITRGMFYVPRYPHIFTHFYIFQSKKRLAELTASLVYNFRTNVDYFGRLWYTQSKVIGPFIRTFEFASVLPSQTKSIKEG